jgi:hypothetical protein
MLASCSGGSRQPTQAELSSFSVQPGPAGQTPFIAFLQVRVAGLDAGGSIQWTIQPQPGSTAPPVSARYTWAALAQRGYASTDSVTVPVHGLQAGAANLVSVIATFADGSAADASVSLDTPPYTPPGWLFGSPTIAQARRPNVPLGFGFYLVKSPAGPPVVMDVDGQVRWVGTGVSSSGATRFTGGGFVVGDPGAPVLHRLELDGTASLIPLAQTDWTDFHHDIATGKTGLLVAVDCARDGRTQLESVLAEVDASGAVLHEWSMGDILARTMLAGGDDPSLFVRDGVDWFHLNSAFYDASDDSILVSSRENFVAKIDYQTGDLIWLFGDPSKYWATFPSLAGKALTLAAGGLWPIGQHAVTMTPDGRLLLFTDGTPSLNQPAGAPAGAALPASSVCTYEIDASGRTARQVWQFDHEPALYSAYCSSAYQMADGTLLIDYAMANGQAVLVGLGPEHQTAFEMSFPTEGCNTAWNAEPIAFTDLVFE